MKYITKGEPSIGSLPYKVDLTNGNIKILETPSREVGDIVLYNKNASKLICISKDSDLSKYPIENYTPVGVVVIPSNHNVYGDNSYGVMSLVDMDYDTPNTGSVLAKNMCWGGYDIDIDTLPNCFLAACVGTCNAPGDELSTIKQMYQYPELPSDNFENKNNPCPHDLNAYYYHNTSNYYAAPSPYFTNGSRNPNYYQTSSSQTPSFLGDFNGKQNTQILCDLATAQADWKTADTIINNYNDSYYPAACCCWRYHTEGTDQGDWYLPAMGELGYVCARFKLINEIISLLITTYGSSFSNLISSNYWASTEYATYAKILDFTDGGSSNRSKANSSLCRAFLHLKI